MADDVKLVRSIGVVGQGGVGKTFLADALLFAAGAVTRVGRSEDGSSNFDWNLAWLAAPSGLTPQTVRPSPEVTEWRSRNWQASVVQPGVSSSG